MPLFQVAILQKPTQKEIEEGKSEQLVLAPVDIVARDAQSAAIGAVMEKNLTMDLSRLEVLVRPFA